MFAVSPCSPSDDWNESDDADAARARLAAQAPAMARLLLDARSLIDALNGNIQGQDQQDVRDPVSYAICEQMIARITPILRAAGVLQ